MKSFFPFTEAFWVRLAPKIRNRSKKFSLGINNAEFYAGSNPFKNFQNKLHARFLGFLFFLTGLNLHNFFFIFYSSPAFTKIGPF
jgi:hypothetical protein